MGITIHLEHKSLQACFWFFALRMHRMRKNWALSVVRSVLSDRPPSRGLFSMFVVQVSCLKNIKYYTLADATIGEDTFSSFTCVNIAGSCFSVGCTVGKLYIYTARTTNTAPATNL